MTEQATNRIAMPLQTRLMPLTAVDNEARTAEVNWTTGAAVRRYDYLNGRYYNEVLSLDPAHVRMDRLASGNTPLLNSHSGVGIESVLGVVETASLNPPTAQVRFSARADVAPIFADVKDRILRNISVGYKVYRFEVTAPITQDSDWTYTAVDWEPYELSLVPIASDPGANVRSQAATAANDCEVVMLNNRNFESTLAREIRARGAELPTAFVDEVCRTARTLDEACRQLVDEVARRQGNLPIGVTMKIVDQAAPAEVFDAMSEMLAARCGGPVPTDRARQYSSLRIVDMARQALEMNGVRTTMMTSDQIIERSLHTTSDFPNLLVNTGNKLLLQGYGSYRGGLKQVARQTTARDFRAIQKVQLGQAPKLEKVLEGGEVKRGTMAEMKEQYSLATYAKIFGLSRQAMINDDLGAFGELAIKFGRAAAEFESQALVDLLVSNPVMSDSVALFNTSHGNKSASPGAISVTTLGAAKQAMRLQKGLDGKTPIDVTPRYLIVPAALETIALQFVAQLTPSQSSAVNPFSGALEVIVDPRLDTVSATVWYVAADPSSVDTLEYAYLEEAPGVQLVMREGFDVEGVELKARLDFGCGVVDWRGLYQNA